MEREVAVREWCLGMATTLRPKGDIAVHNKPTPTVDEAIEMAKKLEKFVLSK